VTIRRAVPADAEAVAALRRTVFPYLLMSAAQVRRAIADSLPAERFAGWVAVTGDELVGWGSCGLNTWTSEPGIGSVNVYVHPEHRKRGLGGTLLDAAEGHLAEISVRRVQTFVTQTRSGSRPAAGTSRTARSTTRAWTCATCRSSRRRRRT